ncbi:MAG: hypothetical protein EOP77_01655 [Variovorax sp.]|nr:MAG: hypothetical protein EOP77_01655 [Variovorax sp.]
MDTLISDLAPALLAVAALALVAIVYLRQRSMGGGWGQGPRETPTVALVRRRRELSDQLREMAGDGGSDLLRAEARRIGGSAGSIEVLEAAVARAERSTAVAELVSTRMAALSGGKGR